jgi:predicted component of viral defense system (DUF524 family)
MNTMPLAETLDFVFDGAVTARMTIFPYGPLVRIPEAEAAEHGEEPLQLQENGRYEYELDTPGLTLLPETGNGAVKPCINPKRAHCGIIEPGLNTGRLGLEVRDGNGSIVGKAAIEVRSLKVDYRNHYRCMMEDITERCVSLLMEMRSPTALRFSPDPGKTFETIHQRYAFLRSLLGSRHFRDALHRITTHPHRRWKAEETICDIRRGFRPDARSQRQLAKGTRRVPLPAGHPLCKTVLSLPERITTHRNVQTDDTPENRFVKFALRSFSGFLNSMRLKLEEIGKAGDGRLIADVKHLENELESALYADIFRGVSEPDLLPLGSPVLQRKEGYREILQAWLRFDMAARLVWQGGEDVYGAGQRDIAALYEYWVFFRLLDIVAGIFKLEKPAAGELIEETGDGFGLKLKSGKHLAVRGSFESDGRILNVEFGYNRTFSTDDNRTKEGSWTKNMRPDYTLSLWPAEFKPEDAEAQELMVHVHFDAKYRVDRLTELFGGDDADAEERLERRGTWKRADLLKMHAYRDAIRRTQGAYILYPGNDAPAKFAGFREILPGLGAFVMKPGSGDEDLCKFIHDVVEHVCNRASARERQTYHVYRVHEDSSEYQVRQQFPECEPETKRRHAPPVETSVLVGWCKDEDHLKWIRQSKLYNFRMNTAPGSLRLKPEIAGAKYLLLHGEGSNALPGLFRIISEGPRVISKDALIKKGYPHEPRHDHYLISDVEPAAEFQGFEWNYKKLESRQEGRKSAWPYHVSLAELMMVRREEL